MTMNEYLRYESPQEVHTANVFIRLTPSEKKLLVTYAKSCGISISAFVRLLLATWNRESLIKIKKDE